MIDKETFQTKLDWSPLIAALNHSRELLIRAAQLRVKNFNLFLVIAGALIAAAYHFKAPIAHITLSFAGLIVSLLFLVLDIRQFRLIKDARCNVEKFEKESNITIHQVDQMRHPILNLPGSQRKRILTTTVAYRTVLILCAITSVGSLVISSAIAVCKGF